MADEGKIVAYIFPSSVSHDEIKKFVMKAGGASGPGAEEGGGVDHHPRAREDCSKCPSAASLGYGECDYSTVYQVDGGASMRNCIYDGGTGGVTIPAVLPVPVHITVLDPTGSVAGTIQLVWTKDGVVLKS